MNNMNNINLKDRLLNVWYNYKKYVIISLFVVLLLIIILIFLLKEKTEDNSKYLSIESIMVYNAKKYVKNNSINNKIYIPLNYLNIKIDQGLACNSSSGVLYDSREYIPYLICDRYKSSKIKEVIDENETNKKYATLRGENPYILSGDNYQELGINAQEEYTINVKEINIENGVNVVKYKILENNSYVGELKRIVIAENIIGSNPEIKLIGNLTRTVSINSPYVESGYSANDKIDGNITSKVIVGGIVDTSKTGTYTLTYSVTNSRGQTTKVLRKIVVNDNNVNLKIESNIHKNNNKSATISLTISGDGYSKTILPNNEESTSSTPTYTVQRNGNYEFIVYDKNNNSETETVKIDMLDTTPPVLSCNGKIKNQTTTINLTANEEIDHFTIKPINGEQKEIKGKTYTYNTSYRDIEVTGYDTSLNSSIVSCNIEYDYVAGVLNNCKNTIAVTNLPIRLYWCCNKNAPVGDDCHCDSTKYDPRYPGGYTFKNGRKVSKDTVTFKEYVQGVTMAEIGGSIKEEYIEKVKLHILMSTTLVWKHLQSYNTVWIENGVMMVPICKCCFQSFRLADYNLLSDSRKAVFEKAYKEVSGLILYNPDQSSLTKVEYRSTLQNNIGEQALAGFKYYEILDSTFVRAYTIKDYGTVPFKTAQIYRCE